MEYLYEALEFIQANGWYLLIGGTALYYIATKYNLSATNFVRIPELHRDRDENEQLAQMERIEAVRARQQAAMDAAAQKYKEEKKRKDELAAQKREQEWDLQQKGQSYRAKNTNSHEDDLTKLGLSRPNKNLTTNTRLRDADYNPLTGQSSSSQSNSCQWRPGQGRSRRGG